MGIFLRNASDEIYQGIVWPGLTAFPDWFSENIPDYWNKYAPMLLMNLHHALPID